MGSSITLTDISHLAHVSVSTVSKVLNNTGRISPQTRRIVQQAALRLGYSSQSLHRISENSFSRLIGLVTSDLEGRFSIPILISAENALGAKKHSVLLTNSRGEPQLERNHIEQLAARGVDGLMVVNAETDPRRPLSDSVTLGIPVVYAYGPSTNPKDCSVICDNVHAGYQAIQHLITLRRTRIAIIAGDEYTKATTDRISGATQAIHDLHGELIGPIRYGLWEQSWGASATQLLLEDQIQFDGLYCLNDQLARGAIEVLTRTGQRVPQDIAVIGHDNWDVVAQASHPTITSFDNNLDAIGQTAARFLLDIIHGKPHSGITQLSCKLILRESTIPLIP